MKKIVSIIIIFLVFFVVTFSIHVLAASLNNINVTTNKQTVHPNENVNVNVEFGEQLGAYTVDIAYDNNLFEYVSADGGTANDNGTRVRVYYFDQTGGSSPRNNMSVTFKAKAGIITSNPTDFSITANGLANADASVSYDDITTSIVKNVVVEPEYVDYNIKLNYTGDIITNEKKDMKIIISSTMGKNYEHTRILAQVTKPSGATVKLLGKDSQGLEHDIVQSGWGDVSGDPIGGKNVIKQLDVKGLFDKAGDYSITLKLIDRDNSDAEIASKTFNITVKDKNSTTNNNNNQTNGTVNNNEQQKNEEKTQEPTTLPKTGNTVYLVAIPVMIFLAVSYFALRKKEF